MSKLAYKNLTYAIGCLWLVAGALWFDYPDWDLGVSAVMASLTYAGAELCVSAYMDREYRLWPVAAFWAWLTVDGSYWLYWELVNPAVSIREGQWPMSLCLFLLAGFTWRAGPEPFALVLRRLRATLARLG